jgi:hypothetical protein
MAHINSSASSLNPGVLFVVFSGSWSSSLLGGGQIYGNPRGDWELEVLCRVRNNSGVIVASASMSRLGANTATLTVDYPGGGQVWTFETATGTVSYGGKVGSVSVTNLSCRLRLLKR